MPSAKPTPDRARVAAALLLAAALALPAAAPAEPPDTWVVKPGETCLGIARVAFGGGKDAIARLHALNPQLGPQPHRLVPGSVLRLRDAPVAELTLVRPRVEARAPGATEWSPAPQGLGLQPRTQVTTLERAGAEVTFADTSRLVLRENAFAIIYGPLASAARAPDRSGQVELVQGEASVSLAALRGETARVATPGASLSAASREVVVAVDGPMSRVSVLDGRAEVSARGKAVALREGEGTRVEKGKAPEPARKLPAAPRLAGAARRVLLSGEGPGKELRLAWAPVPGAARYRVEVARDERFADRIAVLDLAASAAPEAVVPGLTPGRLRARVRAVDGAGLVGPSSAPTVVDVVALRIERGEPGADGVVRGDQEVRLALEAPPGVDDLELTVDGKRDRSPVTLATAGRHLVRVGVPGAAADQAVGLAAEIAGPPPAPPAPPPTPPAPPAPAEPSGPVVEARVAVVSGHGPAAQESPLSSHAAVELHAGWRVSRVLALTLYGSHGPGALGFTACPAAGCGSTSAAGFEAEFSLAPGAASNPWVGLGAGLSWIQPPTGLPQRSTTLLRARLGVTSALARGLAVGPWFGWSLERPEASAGAARPLHGWVAVGVSGRWGR
ncbi:MAG: FecR domain-containing protein [Anaeromyxobacter sp.]